MMSHLSAWHRSQRGFLTLIGLLLVIVIIAMLFAFHGGGGTGTGGTSVDTLGGSVQEARGTVCKNNLAQLRTAISLFSDANGRYPNSLEELDAGISLSCPVGGEPYEYDPATGTVNCVHPGHERY